MPDCPKCGLPLVLVPADVIGDYDVPNGTQTIPAYWHCEGEGCEDVTQTYEADDGPDRSEEL